MGYSNPFALLADVVADDDLSLLISHHHHKSPKKSTAKSPNRPKKLLSATQPTATAPPPKPLPQSKPDRRSDDAENGCDLESGARKKFNVSEDGEFEKPSIGGGGGRSHHRGGPRRSYRSGSRLICRPGREYIDQDAEDHLVTMSSKYRIFDRHSSSFRGNGVKRDGFGRGNWGTMEDEWLEGHQTCNVIEETDPGIVEDDLDVDQIDEDESEDKMTLEEYEKVMEEKKKALQATLLELSAKRNNDADIIKQKESAKVTDDEEYMVDDFVMVEVTEAEAPSSEASKSKAWKFFG